ncbi:MAG TPA: FKBP-type peptidyl-prolyl cis-trans isomerase [Myxococcota bacterium]|nr:FKBP-type peptidyl-prolyl cis-trans isomerase [Myxococcota bacterium]
MLRVAALFAILLLAVACSQGEKPASTGGDAAVTPVADGIEITHLVEGTGASPKATDVVVVHYHGTFPDGQVFDSSVQRGEPARFPLNRVIPCWTQGLQTMKVGGKAKLVCSPQTAYGDRGAPPRIPPNATLNFEVELIDIQSGQ